MPGKGLVVLVFGLFGLRSSAPLNPRLDIRALTTPYPGWYHWSQSVKLTFRLECLAELVIPDIEADIVAQPCNLEP